MSKIVEVQTEPAKVVAGSKFKIKVKVIRYLSYTELKNLKISKIKEFTIKQVKGEGEDENR